MGAKFVVIGKYESKFGLILYTVKVVGDPEVFAYDLNNCYLNTFYYKGDPKLIEINHIYNFQYIKGENGLTYCFLT